MSARILTLIGSCLFVSIKDTSVVGLPWAINAIHGALCPIWDVIYCPKGIWNEFGSTIILLNSILLRSWTS